MWKLHRYIPCNKTCKTEQTQMFPKEIFIIIILIILILRLICLYKSAGSTQFVAWEPQAPAALGWLRLCWFAIEKAGPGRNAWIWCAWSFKVSKDSITLLFPLKSSAVRLSNKVSNKVDFICWTWENEPKKNVPFPTWWGDASVSVPELLRHRLEGTGWASGREPHGLLIDDLLNCAFD